MSKTSASGGSRQSKWLMIGALIAAILMGAGRLGAGLIDTGGTGSVPEPDCVAAIAWDDAGAYEGDQKTVRGPVVNASHLENVSGQPTFLNIGRDHPDPDRFTIVIWSDVRAQFDQTPETLFAGQEVCVAGDIQMHEGSPQIELDGPAAITLAN